MGAFGDKFRTERERRGFTLDDVSNVTKISSRMLKAIEEEHFDLLPGGVFNKGFVRAYAKHLGFNDQELVSEYLAALRQAQIQAQTAAWEPNPPPPLRNNSPQPEQAPAGQVRTEQPRAEQRRPEPLPADKGRVDPKPSPPAVSSGPNKTVFGQVSGNLNLETKREVAQKTRPLQKAPDLTPAQVVTASEQNPPPASHSGGSAPRRDSIPWKVPAVVFATLIIAAVMWNRHSRVGQAEATTSPRPADSQSATLPLGPQTAPAHVGTPTRDLAAPSAPTANSVPQSNQRYRSNSESAAGTSTAAVARPPRDIAPEHLASDHAATNQPIPDHSVPRKSASATKAPPVFTLRVRASESTWISVTADGQPLSHETLIAPASTSFRASREITVKVGNAAAVSFLLNGKEIPPQGKEAEVKSLSFDSKGLKESGPASTPDAPR